MAAYGGHASSLRTLLAHGGGGGGQDLEGNTVLHLACDVNGWMRHAEELFFKQRDVKSPREGGEFVTSRQTLQDGRRLVARPHIRWKRGGGGKHNLTEERHEEKREDGLLEGWEAKQRRKAFSAWQRVEIQRRTESAGPCVEALSDLVSSLHSISNQDGDQPLHLAAAGGAASAVELLLQAGAHVNEKNHAGETPLMLAAATGHAEVVRILLEAKAEDQEPEGPRSPFFLALTRGHFSASVAFLECGTPVQRVSDLSWR